RRRRCDSLPEGRLPDRPRDEQHGRRRAGDRVARTGSSPQRRPDPRREAGAPCARAPRRARGPPRRGRLDAARPGPRAARAGALRRPWGSSTRTLYAARVTLAWLTELERVLATSSDADALVIVAAAAGRSVPVGADEAHAVTRRALLLHAAGGHALRSYDLDGRAVVAAAADLDSPARREALR